MYLKMLTRRALEIRRNVFLLALLITIIVFPSLAMAQGSIFGSVQNSDLTVPANGEIRFVGFLDNTDQEIRIELSDGAGYDAGNWYDDFQNYQNESAGNPYDYYFANTSNGEAFHLESLIPANSFQQEDIQLAPASLPSAPANLTAVGLSSSSMLVSWSGQPGLTYHVYRRYASSNGSYFRRDNLSGDLADHGVTDTFFVDNTVDGVSSYTYLIIAEDASGNYSAHSDPVTGNSAVLAAPSITSIDPNTGFTIGGTFVNIYGSNFDPAGVTVTFGGIAATSINVVSPQHVTAVTPAGSGVVDVEVTNTASALSGVLTSAYTYFANSAPVVADIPDQTIAEGATFTAINLDDYVTDIDNADNEITWTYSGNTDLTVSIVDRVATITIPDVNWNGAETITFTATDPGDLAASDPATFTVTPVNDAPVVADIPDQSVAEGTPFTTISLDDFVTDIDNPDTDMAWTFSGNVNLNVSIDVNRVATITPIDPNWNGSETITFTATDPGTASDSDPATFTVTAVNDAPVVADIPDQLVAEGTPFATINLDDYVDDVDNLDSDITWTYSGDVNLSVSIDVSRVATITPIDPNWNGSETITFTATDPGTASDSDPATFTVTAVNDAPVVADIPDQSVAEGTPFATINLDDYVSDVDNLDSEITWTYSGDVNLGVSIDVNRIATITPIDPNWNGSETITFTATDPGALFASDAATFTVTPVNDAPVVADIPDQSIAEGGTFATINLDDYVDDVDNPDSEISWTYAGDVNLTISIDVNRVATITPIDPNWNGSETITFTATDPGLLSGSDAATFTVSGQNDPPVVADIPDQSVAEGSPFATINLDDYVDDIDNLDSEITWSYSGDVNLSVSIDVNRVATITPIDPNWNGSETITFTATDPGALSNSDAATFTVTPVNDAPVVADIPDQAVAEGTPFATIALDDYVDDIDNLDSEITWTYSGDVNLSVSIDVNRVATIAPIDPNWNGLETITFTATDPGALSASDAATFTISAENDPPIVADIPDQTVAEGNPFATINLDDYVDDIDNPDSEIVWTYSGNVNLDVSIDANRVATITALDPDWNGSEVITFTATDPGLLSNSDAATFTVTPVNDAPVVSDIPDQTVAEGAPFATISLDDYVDDIDNPDSEIVWTYAGDVNLTISIDVNRVATITPIDPNWNGSETITFTATDIDGLFASDDATFTVTAVNNAPVVSDIPDQTVAEGDLFTTINLDDYVDDIDNPDSDMVWTFSGNINLDVNIDANRVATITALDSNWNGSETITFTATDPGTLSGSDPATFTVTPVNDAPVVADIPDQAIPDGGIFDTIILDDYVTDVDDADSVMTWTYSGNVELIVDITNRVATVAVPSPEWVGTETIVFRATDPGALYDEDTAVFTVSVENDPPVVAGIPDQTIDEGASFATIVLDNYVTDPDDPDSVLTWSYSGNSQLTVSIVGHIATITTPNADYFGSENIIFRATDPGLMYGEDTALFTVTQINDRPVLDSIGPKFVMEGQTLNFTVTASDVDLTIPQLIAENLPLNATFTDNLNGSGSFSFSPDNTQSGVYNVLFYATDGILSDSETVQIVVNDLGNQAPVFDTILPQIVLENDTISLTVHAVDPEGGVVSLFMTTDLENTSFVDNGDGTGLFTYTPSYYQAGIDTVRFTATDDGIPPASRTRRVQITTLDINQPPVIDSIGPKAVLVGDSLLIHVTASDSTDPDGGLLYLSALDKPLNSTFVDSGTNAGLFNFKPTLSQVGEDTLKIICFDDEDPGLSDVEIVPITIVAANQPPVLDPIGPKMVTEGDTLIFTITASDIDGPMLNLYASPLPENSEFVDSGGGVGVFTFYPNFVQSGLKSVKFTATDGILSDHETVLIQVYDNPQRPILTLPSDTFMTEGEHLEFSLSAEDPDQTTPDLILDNPELNVTFTDIGNGTALFEFDPVYVQSGTYNFLFIADDGTLADSGYVTVTVNDAGNQMPNIYAPDTVTGMETDLITFTVNTTDADSIIPVITAVGVPSGATFTDNQDYSADFSWQTVNLNTGTYPIWVHVEDGADAAVQDSALVVVVVNDLNMPPSKLFVHEIKPDSSTFPVGITAASVNEGDTLLLRLESEDPDLVPCSLSVGIYDTVNHVFSPIPATAVLVDSLNGMGSYTYVPTYTESGQQLLRFLAIDRTSLVDSLHRDVRVTIMDVPQFPHIDTIPPQTITEGDSLGIQVSFSDMDSPPPTFYADSLPTNAYIVNQGNPLARLFVFKPGFTQAGSYNVYFRVVDNTGRADTLRVPITVNDAGPQAPVLNLPLAANITLTVADSIKVRMTATDVDGDPITLRMEGNPAPPNAVFVDSTGGVGSFYYKPDPLHVGFTYNLRFIASDGVLEDTAQTTVTVVSYLCGDANHDQAVNVSDAVYIINYIFTGGAPPSPLMAADTNGSGSVNVSDAVFLINYIFLSGPRPICEG